jgi:benzoate membrane transport protein
MQAAEASGASPAHIASWLLALGLALGATSIGFSWLTKMPILTAWSTPGAAMLISVAPNYTMQESIGAFIISGALIFITGLVKPINHLLNRIPSQIATAMLAAILLPFCLRAFTQFENSPFLFLTMFISYLVGRLLAPRYTMLILLIVGIGHALFSYDLDYQSIDLTITMPVMETPSFSLGGLLNLALPLYLVTMLSQNLPGIAMLKSHGLKLNTAPLFFGTGVVNMIAAPFGGFSTNLAAITAAICMNDTVDKDPNQRYKAAIWAGLFYLIAGCWAGAVVSLFLLLPTSIIALLAGFALLGTLLMCLQTTFSNIGDNEPALVTFLVALSGVTYLGISAPILGLVAGIVLFALKNRIKP